MSQSPDNLYDGALLLLRSWVACIESGDNNQRDIIANLMDDTRSLLRDEREREGNFFNAPESAAAAPVPAEEKPWEHRDRIINSAEALKEEMRSRLAPDPKKVEAGRLGGLARQKKLREQPCLACSTGEHHRCVIAVLETGQCGCFCQTIDRAPASAPREDAAIRRKAFDEAIAIVQQQRERSSAPMGFGKPFGIGRAKRDIIAALIAARETPTEKEQP